MGKHEKKSYNMWLSYSQTFGENSICKQIPMILMSPWQQESHQNNF